MTELWQYVAALIPPIGLGFLFWLVIKNVIEGDRKERLAHSQWEREHQSPAAPENEKPHSTPEG
jgi:hypothetical protein